MKHIKRLPDTGRLRSLLKYEPKTGGVFWLVNAASSVPTGSEAGTLGPDGYLRVSIDGEMYALHRVIWKLHYGTDPVGVVDHRDGIGSDNRLEQLRDSTQRQNLWNVSVSKNSKTGLKGVVFDAKRQVFQVNIKDSNGRRAPQGSFPTIAAAKSHLDDLRRSLHGEFACDGGRRPSGHPMLLGRDVDDAHRAPFAAIRPVGMASAGNIISAGDITEIRSS
ncbi:HNH endonuclease [Bradyrhizobium sp. 174]|uniref:HNH endonuclease n=1 Tax=Bradyrhizobium sp. 174 TaxID=2782645 RepID=UPI001FF82BE5|nr:HNH endonuclease [Bradyrhizobium sp. 174]MCK1577845.1 HNH endonuclease [Bradyrhizobium sp. 174]